MRLRVIQPGETREDPHAEQWVEIRRMKQILADMKLCNHWPVTVDGCRGCVAWIESWKLRP